MCRYIVGGLNFVALLFWESRKTRLTTKIDWKRGSGKWMPRQAVHCVNSADRLNKEAAGCDLKYTNLNGIVEIKAWLVWVQDKMKTGRWYTKQSRATFLRSFVVKRSSEIEMWGSGVVLVNERFSSVSVCY